MFDQVAQQGDKVVCRVDVALHVRGDRNKRSVCEVKERTPGCKLQNWLSSALLVRQHALSNFRFEPMPLQTLQWGLPHDLACLPLCEIVQR